MKKIFLEAREDKDIILPEDLITKLPKKIIVFTTVQHIGQLDRIIKQLNQNDISVKTHKLTHTEYEAQILGCSIKELKDDSDAYLYIGDGMFHPKALVLKNSKDVFAYNPYTKKTSLITKDDIKDMVKRKKAGLTKFHTSNNIGVLVTTKPGQNRIRRAEKLRGLFPDKNFYFLIADTIDFAGLEDFNYIECFVNTACPRIGYDDSIKVHKPVINLEDLDDKDW